MSLSNLPNTVMYILLVCSSVVIAGPNKDFRATILTDPNGSPNFSVTTTNVEAGSNTTEIYLAVVASNISRISNVLIVANYNPTYLSPIKFAAGELLPGAFSVGNGLLPADPSKASIGADSTADTQGGATILGIAHKPTLATGILGVFHFEILEEIPEYGTFISITRIVANASVADPDGRDFPAGTFGVNIVPIQPNRILSVKIDRGHDNATVTWRTRYPGVDDRIAYRVLGSTKPVSVEYYRLASGGNDPLTITQKKGIRALLDSGIDVRTIDDDALAKALAVIGINVDSDELPWIRPLAENIQRNVHQITLVSLLPDTEYEVLIRSTDLAGQTNPRSIHTFRTRSQPDLRPVLIEQIDVKPLHQSVAVFWKTSRRANSRLRISTADGNVILDSTKDADGVDVHLFDIRGTLGPSTEYTFLASSRGIGLYNLVSRGLMSESDASDLRFGLFRTKARDVPLNFISPPHIAPGIDAVHLFVELNQPATVIVNYGEVGSDPKGTGDALYSETVLATDALPIQAVALTGLQPSTHYRYRIVAVTPGNNIKAQDKRRNNTGRISTDPRGNRLWSRDLRFTTSTGADTLDPVIIKGPQVFKRAKLALFRWTTDVATEGTVYVGTTGNNGTLGTVDEIEVVDIDKSGQLRLCDRHFVVVRGLARGTRYGYRIEATAANGKTVVFDPLSSTASKRARVLQPPGGSGSFITDLVADTQVPVILTGPTVSSKTHDKAVIEWTTDEPADSEMRFGTNLMEGEESSGDNELEHTIILTNLDRGATYNYIVGSTDVNGNGVTESAQATFTTDPEIDLTPPTITVGPEVVYRNDETATIQWSTNEVATAAVEFGPNIDLGYVRSLTTTDKTHQITLTNLTTNTTYSYKASSTDLNSNGPTESEVLTFTTDESADLTPPILSSITTTTADSSAIITWITDELADSFIEFGQDSTVLELSLGDTEDELKHEMILTNLEPGTTYFYTVGSVDRADNPPTESTRLNFKTLDFADVVAPNTPVGISGSAAAEQALFSWEANTEADLAGYNIYRRLAGNAVDFSLIISRLDETSYVDKGLDNDVSYEYQITAIDRASTPNESDPSDSIFLTPVSDAAPSTPTNLSRQGEDPLQPTFVFYNSTPAVAGMALTYTIQLSTQPDFSDVTSYISGLPENSGDFGNGKTGWAIDRTLEEDFTYYWRVRAVEDGLNGAFCDPQEFTAKKSSGLIGDFDGDGMVGFSDFFLFVTGFNRKAENEFAIYDLDNDGLVGFADFFIFADNFGKRSSGKRPSITKTTDFESEFSIRALGGSRQQDRIIRVDLLADRVQNLQAFGAVINYDPSKVVFIKLQNDPGALLEIRGGKSPLLHVLSQSPGQIAIGNGITVGPSVSGGGMLAACIFQAIGPVGRIQFNLEKGLIAHPNGDVAQVQTLRSTVLRPKAFELENNFPNPFNPSTSIEYALPHRTALELNVYDALGCRVRQLVQAISLSAGHYSVVWDGLDEAGRPAGSGIYFYRLTTPSYNQTQKMTLIK